MRREVSDPIEGKLWSIFDEVVARYRSTGESLADTAIFRWPLGGALGAETYSYELIAMFEDAIPRSAWNILYNGIHTAVREQMPAGFLVRVTLQERAAYIREKAVAAAAIALRDALAEKGIVASVSIASGPNPWVEIAYPNDESLPAGGEQERMRLALRRDAIDRGLPEEVIINVTFASPSQNAESNMTEAQLRELRFFGG
jgi:hypothetical protein